MPVGSPGMEGGAAEPYEVVLFGPTGRRSFMRFPYAYCAQNAQMSRMAAVEDAVGK
jgi:hypothetical protein